MLHSRFRFRGGAGIRADLKTFTALEVYGLTVVTAVTAQNTREVRGLDAPADAVRTQIEAVVDGFSIGAWKTGMPGNASNIRAVAESLPDGAVLVIDPVMIPTSGHRLLDDDAVADLVERFIPADIVTPNLPEAEVLGRMRVATPTIWPRPVGGSRPRHKGRCGERGHLAGDAAVDIFIDRDGVVLLSGRRYPYSVHGSGAASLRRSLHTLPGNGCAPCARRGPGFHRYSHPGGGGRPDHLDRQPRGNEPSPALK